MCYLGRCEMSSCLRLKAARTLCLFGDKGYLSYVGILGTNLTAMLVMQAR